MGPCVPISAVSNHGWLVLGSPIFKPLGLMGVPSASLRSHENHPERVLDISSLLWAASSRCLGVKCQQDEGSLIFWVRLIVEGKRETGMKLGFWSCKWRLCSPAVGGTFSPGKGRLRATGLNKSHRVSQAWSLPRRSPCIIYSFRMGSLRFPGRKAG